MVVQPDGKIVLSSNRERHYRVGGTMARFNPDGSLDTAFGARGGLVDFRGRSVFGPVAVQPDGELVVATGDPLSTGKEGFLLRGYQADGSSSLGFGVSGLAVGAPVEPGWTAMPSALLRRGDGRLVVGGDVILRGLSGKAPTLSLAAAQLFDQDGSFAETVGRVDRASREDVGNTSLADLLQRPDGSLIAVGESEKYENRNILLARFLPGSGASFDTSFAAGTGFSLTNPYPKSWGSPPTRANTVIAVGGGLVAAGTARGRVLLVGFDADGALDPTFGQEGFDDLALEGSVFAEVTAAVVQPDGKIVIAGRTHDRCTTEPERGCWNLFVGRLHPNGSVDSGFGSDGFSRLGLAGGTELSQWSEDEFRDLVDVAVAAGGKILVSETPKLVGGRLLRVTRLDAGGNLDSRFGRGGVATAAPCTGSTAELRRVGCFSSALVGMRAKRLNSRRPRLRLRVRSSERLDPLRNVRLLLPPALAIRDSSANRIRIDDQAGASLGAVHSRLIGIDGLDDAGSISLTLPRGVLKRTKQIARGHKLVFRVQVWFQDGSKQTIVLRRAG